MDNEDIEILETFIRNIQEEYTITEVDGKPYRIENFTFEFKPTKRTAQAIKNLIEENKIQRKQLNDAFVNGFIHKDKIKEQLTELDNMKVDGEVFTTAVNFAKKILQELLEERN